MKMKLNKTENKATLFLFLAVAFLVFSLITAHTQYLWIVFVVGGLIFFLTGHHYVEKHRKEVREEGEKMWKELYDSLKQIDSVVDKIEKMVKEKQSRL